MHDLTLRVLLATSVLLAAMGAAPSDPPKPGAEPPAAEPAKPEAAPQSPAPAAQNPPAQPAAPRKPEIPPGTVIHCDPQQGLPREKLRFFGEDWDCELCLDEASRTIGMGARSEFPAGTAMIFVHPRPRMLSYWMKDCLVDIDIVFVDAEGIVTAAHEAKKQPLRKELQALAIYENKLARYGSNRHVKYALEFPPGTIKRTKVAVGQRISIDWKSLDARAK
jgi:uncharacterized membrane protein (UPF0127 family)